MALSLSNVQKKKGAEIIVVEFMAKSFPMKEYRALCDIV